MIYKYKIDYKSIGGSSSTSTSSTLSSSIPSLNAIDDIYNDFLLVINELTYSDIISIFKTIKLDPKIKKDHVIEIKKIFNESEEDIKKINNLFTYLRNNKIIINKKLILKYYHKLLYIQPIINELEHSSIVNESKKTINVETKLIHVENIKKIFNESFKPIVIGLSKEEIKRKMNNLFTYLKKNEISIREIYYPLKYIFDNDSLRRAVNLWVSDKSKAIELYNDINTWDVSQVTDMSELFQLKYNFNDNISEWDTSNVKDMSSMFKSARSFDKPLNNWDVSNVTNMSSMFSEAELFNKNIGNWNTSNVKDMSSMFRNTNFFNKNISYWNTSNVTNMSYMFKGAIKFDKDIYTRVLPDGKIAWDVSNVTNMESMFAFTKSFNGNISNWNTSNVVNMKSMFLYTYKFDGKISILSTPISSSSSSSISSSSNLKLDDLIFPESMRFGGTKVNHFNRIKKINSEKEIHEYLINNGISIKKDYNKTSRSRNPNNSEDKLSNMYGIIKPIDGDLKIQNINTKIVVNTKNEYLYTAWDVLNVENISDMFKYAILFDGDISKWNISNVSNMMDLFNNASIFNRDINTENITINNNTYTAWDVSRIENMHGIFVGTKKFNGNIDMWNTSNVTDMSAMFSSAEAFNKDINTREITKEDGSKYTAWNVSKVRDMYRMFSNTKEFNGNISNWDTSNVKTMEQMFVYAKKFDQDIGNWNVSNVQDMSRMFSNAESFNKDISNWNTTNVRSMRAMFFGAPLFNQNLAFKQVRDKNNNFLYTAWNLSNVRDMGLMFSNAESFNGKIWTLNVSRVYNFEDMFNGAKNFNDPRIGYWKIGNNTNTNNMFLGSGITEDTFKKDDQILPYRRNIARILSMPEEYMNLYIKTISGYILTIKVNPFDKIINLKFKIQNANENLTIDRQRLIFNKQILDDNNTIIYYNIKTDDQIYLVLKLVDN